MNNDIDIKPLENVEASLKEFIIAARAFVTSKALPRKIYKDFERTAGKCQQAIDRARVDLIRGENPAVNILVLKQLSKEMEEVFERAERAWRIGKRA
jgi:hypothetical protein